MVEWLHMEEMPLRASFVETSGKFVWPGIGTDTRWGSETEGQVPPPPAPLKGTRRRAGAKHTRLDVALRALQILHNRKLFGRADTIVFAIVLDGRWNPKSGFSMASKSFFFPRVKDGDSLSIGPDRGVVIYDGVPAHFLNLHIVAVRDTEATREFAKVLQASLSPDMVGELAGAGAVALGAPGMAADTVRTVAKSAVDTAIAYYREQGNPPIGAFYESLTGDRTQNSRPWGLGLHPSDYPESTIRCGDTMSIAYEVSRSRT